MNQAKEEKIKEMDERKPQIVNDYNIIIRSWRGLESCQSKFEKLRQKLSRTNKRLRALWGNMNQTYGDSESICLLLSEWFDYKEVMSENILKIDAYLQ